MQLRAALAKIGIGVSLFFLLASSAYSMPETDAMTICYGVSNHGEMTYKTPCIVTNTGGGGSIVTIYQFNDSEYTIVSEQSGDWLNGESFQGYPRGQFFERLEPSSMEYSYYCYQSQSVHFCSKQ